MHFTIRILLFAFSLFLGWPSLACAAAHDLPILVYHQIRASGDEPADGPIAISLERFTAQMKYLHDQGYTTLDMDEVVQFLNGKLFPEKIVAIHFDDGWKSAQYAVPVLDRFGLKASFWIIAGAGHDIGSPHMDWDEILRLAKNPLIDIESHTMSHPWKQGDTLVDWVEGKTPGKGIEQAKWELTESRRLLEEKLGRPVSYLAWPAGNYDDVLIRLAKKAGYTALVTIDAGFNHPGDDLLHIRRDMIDGQCSDKIFQQILVDGQAHNCISEQKTN